LIATRVLTNTYRDSGTLMTLASRIQQLPGVERAMSIMATPRNLELLATMIELPALQCGPSDLLVVVEGSGADTAIARVDELLVRRVASGSPGNAAQPRTIDAALAVRQANLAVISVPGPFAAREARRAMRRGLHVFLFSNGVSVEDEVSLKLEAESRGLLLMGPDCGTAILDGVPIGFANRVRRGNIGIVGASGTGIQEISTLVHRLGGGISQAIGTGSKDLSDAVGGRATLRGLEFLARDEATEVIVLVSKPPSPAVADRVRASARATGKRVVQCFLGGETTLEDAALEACGLPVSSRPSSTRLPAPIVGLYSGGTLASEARKLTGGDIIDLGDDEFTRGRPHPMIDPTIRIERIREVPPEATLLLDVVLGEGSHPDPAGALADALRQRGGRTFASVCGTELDPQNRHSQIEKLRAAGVVVARSNAAAALGVEDDLPPSALASAPPKSRPLLGAPLSVINLGLSSFAENIEAHGVPVTRIDWSPPAGGDEELARILDALM
jgi:FdrA protein